MSVKTVRLKVDSFVSDGTNSPVVDLELRRQRVTPDKDGVHLVTESFLLSCII